MSVNRRDFFKMVSAASVAAGFSVQCSSSDGNAQPQATEQLIPHTHETLDHYQQQWILINADSTATALTGRTEMGQGSMSVFTSAVAQGLKLDPADVNVLMGDTDVCPDNGSTNGSNTTINHAWPFFVASRRLAGKLVERGAAEMGVDKGTAFLRDGKVWSGDEDKSIAIGDLDFSDVVIYRFPPGMQEGFDDYKDPGTGNILGRQIVTGELKYVGDLYLDKVFYAGFLTHKYHFDQYGIKSVNFEKAKRVPKVRRAKVVAGFPAVVARTYTALQKGLEAIEVEWKAPTHSKDYNPVQEIRAGRKLIEVIEKKGDSESAYKEATRKLGETYVTHHTSHCPIEPDSAMAEVDDDRQKAKLWVSSQYPHGQRANSAERLGYPEENIHVIGMPIGGGYGGKINSACFKDTAALAKRFKVPVKHIYSQANQFGLYSRAKEIVVVDLNTAVDDDGKLIARKIDVHQDEGKGISVIYDCPNSTVQHFNSPLTMRHAVIRGTSYIQNIFALESHMSEVALANGWDPLEFRKKNFKYDAHAVLLERAAEMIGYGRLLPENEGIGMGVINHGADELGAIMAHVSIHPKSGKVTVKKITGAFDIGIVMNRRNVEAGVKGAFMWGIGYALLEELKVDGQQLHTKSMWDYEVPRFSDMPEMETDYLQVHPHYGGPRGVGEMPMVPVVPAIANAIRNAIGVRMHRTPFTPARVKAAWQQQG